MEDGETAPSAKDLFFQALAAQQAGQGAEAERLYGAVLDQDPASRAALANWAVLLFQRGAMAEGLALLDRSLAVDPVQPRTLVNRANALAYLNRFDDALADCETALALEPGALDAGQLRLTVLAALGRPDPELLAAYGRAAGGGADALTDLGNLLNDRKQAACALALFDEVAKAHPDMAAAHNNRSASLYLLGRLEEALGAARRAIALDPASAAAWANQGCIQMDLNQDAQGVASLEQAVALRPDSGDFRYNLGKGLAKVRRIDEAVAAYDQADASPGFQTGRVLWNKAVLLVGAGRPKEGWPLFEHRWDVMMTKPDISDTPYWLGEDIAGQTLLIHHEQGLGDTLQMLRYAPLLTARGVDVILGVQKSLAALARPLAPRLLDDGDAIPPHDRHCFMMSLPMAMGAAEGVIPAAVPYLTAPAEAVARWAALLGPPQRRRIGLVWSGNPVHANDRNRSLPLAALAPLLDAEADFVSLQTQVWGGDRLVLDADSRIAQVLPGDVDLSETAGLIMALDLVVTVDTAVAHLAGALGKPVWILLPYNPDFRWGLEGAATPWYPTARLFRQPAMGDWDSALAAVAHAVSAFCKEP